MRVSTVAAAIVVAGAMLTVSACAPAEYYDPYAHPNTTARYFKNPYYDRSYSGPGYYPPRSYYYPGY